MSSTNKRSTHRAPTKRPSAKVQAAKKPATRAASSTRRSAASSTRQVRSRSQAPNTRRTASSPSSSNARRARPSNSARTQRSTTTRQSKPVKPNSHVRGKGGTATLSDRIISSKPAMIIIAVLLLFVVLFVFDTASNWGKAYGNVSVGGVDVAGKTKDEIQQTVRNAYANRIAQTNITIYANEDWANENKRKALEEEQRATAEQVSAEDATAAIGSWQTDALSLKAVVDYNALAEKAVQAGRDEGFLSRLGLLFGKDDIPIEVTYDTVSLEALATEIDNTTGDPRADTTVEVSNGEAYVQEGHDGQLIDRGWLADQISKALLSENNQESFVSQTQTAHSRITTEQAQRMANAVNNAIKAGASFSYEGKTWDVDAFTLGIWTTIDIAQKNGGYDLQASINQPRAITDVIEGVDARITSEDMTVSFEKNGNDIWVHTSGSGKIPEVKSAVASLNDQMYGEAGTAWSQGASPVKITVEESERPENLSFQEAADLGIITVIGEYTTTFSNAEGTENRNHNIKLAAEILNDGIVKANGEVWNFNERSGDTNDAAGFWSAGSIVDGEYVDSIGGGICQVATTIFNAVYDAGLPITERHNHTLYIASYPTGRDAAVDYPTMSLRWKNDQPSDILLKTSHTDESITATLYGVALGYVVTTETGAWEEGEKYGTRFEVDSSLDPNLYYRKTTGSDGSKITVTRTVKDKNGNLVSTTPFVSNYDAKDEVYVVGTDVDKSKLKRDTNA